MIKFDGRLKPLCKRVISCMEDMREAWQYGNGKRDEALRYIKYTDLVVADKEYGFYGTNYAEFLINKVVIVIDKFLYNEYLYLYTANKKNIALVTQSSAPANNGRVAFLRDVTKSSVVSVKPTVFNIDECNKVRLITVGRRSRVKFRVYPKCKVPIPVSKFKQSTLGSVVEDMSGDLPDIYFGPYSNKTAYNTQDAQELQEIGIHFRLRVFVYLTYSKLYCVTKDVSDVNVL